MIKKLPLIHQNYFMQSPLVFQDRRYFIDVAGYGAGKTSGLGMATEYLAGQLQGMKDAEGHRPRIILGGVTLAHLEKTTLGNLKQDLERSQTRYKHDTKNNILTIGDVDVLVTPLQNPKEIMGYDAVAALLDEVDDLGVSTAEDTTFEAVRAINERTRQRIPGFRTPFIMMGSTSQGQKGLYRLYTQFRKTGTGYVLIRGRTKDNWHLDPSYVQSMYDMYNDIERKVYLEGEFLALAKEQVFGDFDWNRNYMDFDLARDVKENETLYWGQDFNQGYHRGCIAVVREGTIYIVKRYEFPLMREAARVVRYDFPRQKIYFIPDTTAKDEINHFVSELVANDIRIINRSKNPIVEDSAFLVNKLLYTRRLIVTRGAKETAEMLSLQQRDKNGQITKGVGPKSPVHDTDSVRLISYFLACNRKEFANIADVTINRHRSMFGDEPAIEDLANGYKSISPSLLM